MNITKYLLILVLAQMLQGCVNAAVTGAQAVYNHHSIQNNLQDQYIAIKAEREIYVYTNRFKDTHVTVSSFNGIVLILGQIQNEGQRIAINNLVNKIDGVKEVHDQMTISAPSSSLTRVSDSWITTKIKTQLIAMKDVDATQIKVITENGVVYLMGIVPPEQAEIAVDLAKSTDGVQSIVKVFYYIHISKV